MDYHFSPEDEAWRSEVQHWIANAFGAVAQRDLSTNPEEQWEYTLAAHRKLARKGWMAPGYPKEFGGLGASFFQQAIFNEELAYHRVPGPDLVSVGMAGPTLMLYGTPEQKEHVAKILQAEEHWCQGYSEPGSGSDLASLQTRAVLDGDEYVLNGQKIWTSNAHHTDWMFLLVRTNPDAPKHRGITYLLLDMKTPGVSVRPLINMLGNHAFNEVYFDNVRVPVSNRVGEENRGWYVGMTTADFERSSLSGSAALRRNFEDLVSFVQQEGRSGTASRERDVIRHEIAEMGIEIEVSRMLAFRTLSMQQAGQIPNYEASVGKLFASELSQRFARLAVRVMNMYGQVRSGSPWSKLRGLAAESYMQSVPATIAGGTSEIQRGIIATRGLGLPRG